MCSRFISFIAKNSETNAKNAVKNSGNGGNETASNMPAKQEYKSCFFMRVGECLSYNSNFKTTKIHFF